MKTAALVVAVVACSAPTSVLPPAEPVTAASVAPGLVAGRLPDGVVPLSYDLRLEVDPDRPTFRGHVAIRIRLAAPSDRIWLHAVDLDIDHVTATGIGELHAVAGTGEVRALVADRPLPAGELTVELDYVGRIGAEWKGLFRQSFAEQWFLYSQAESIFARRIVPCFDEPRWKTPWTVTIVAPTGLVALSNAPQTTDRELGDGRHEVHFMPTRPLPPYLVAIAVGPFELVDGGTVGRAHLPLRFAVLPGDRARVHATVGHTAELVSALEDYLDDPLPNAKVDLAEVPHLFGAMEHPGLITFERTILASNGTREDIDEFDRTAAHELAHQWFGNSVTPVWWDDLWLAEAFASFLGDRVAAAHDPDRPFQRAQLREHALAVDSGPDARPLRRGVTDDPEGAFDVISYDKGEIVLETFEHWLGADLFRSALRSYVRAHRDGTATVDDLIAAITAVSTPALGAALKFYVEHVGPPVVALTLHCDATPPRIDAEAATGGTIPLCVRTPAGRSCALVGKHAELPLVGCPAWVVGDDDAGYYLVAWRVGGGAMPPLAELAPGERVAFGDDVAAAVTRGDTPLAVALGELDQLARPHDRFAQLGALAIARAIDPYVADAARPAWSKWLYDHIAAREPELVRLAHDARDFAVRGAIADLVTADQLPPAVTRAMRDAVDHGELEPATVAFAAATGGVAIFNQLVAAATATSDADDRVELLGLLGELGPEQIAPTIDLLVANALPSKAVWIAIARFLERGVTRQAAWQAIAKRLPEILDRMTGAQIATAVSATAVLCDRGALAEVRAGFEPHVAEIPDGRRVLDRTLGAIERCAARRDALGDVAATLKLVR